MKIDVGWWLDTAYATLGLNIAVVSASASTRTRHRAEKFGEFARTKGKNLSHIAGHKALPPDKIILEATARPPLTYKR